MKAFKDEITFLTKTASDLGSKKKFEDGVKRCSNAILNTVGPDCFSDAEAVEAVIRIEREKFFSAAKSITLKSVFKYE